MPCARGRNLCLRSKKVPQAALLKECFAFFPDYDGISYKIKKCLRSLCAGIIFPLFCNGSPRNRSPCSAPPCTGKLCPADFADVPLVLTPHPDKKGRRYK